MEVKEWFKWTFIFMILGGLTASVFVPYDFIPSAQAYSYDDAKNKIVWDAVKNNTILIYTKEPTYLGNAIQGVEEVWAVYEPCQYEFKKFVNTKSFSEETLEQEDKIVYLFSETGDDRSIKWNSLNGQFTSAYKNLRKCLPTGARHKFLGITPNFVS